MICKNCGCEYADTLTSCPQCGAYNYNGTTEEPAGQNQQNTPPYQYGQQNTPPYQYAQNNANPYMNGNGYSRPQSSNGLAIAGFVCSLLNISVVGLILSIIGYKKAKEMEGNPNAYKGLALAGIIIGALGIAWQLATIIFYILLALGFIGAASMPTDIPGLEDAFENTLTILAAKIR